jgi:hypothetical protein
MNANNLNVIGLQDFVGLEIFLVNADSARAVLEFDVKGPKEQLRKTNGQLLFGVTSAEFEGHQVKLTGLRSTWSDDRSAMRFEAFYCPL